MKKALGAFFLICQLLQAQDLTITPDDVRIVPSVRGGYDLFIRKKPGIMSVLLTESTADPDKKADVYAYRSPVFDEENGNEKRMLDGKFLSPDSKLYSLIDSTPEAHPEFLGAFRIFIPYVIEYGYSWSRHGQIQVDDGLFINIRTFAKPYGDYTGAWQDNPFMLKINQAPLEGKPDDRYIADTIEAYKDLTPSDLVYSEGPDDLSRKIGDILDGLGGENLQIVLALDTTSSMKDDFPALKRDLVPMLKSKTAKWKTFELGMTLYRDYMENYITKNIPFSSDWKKIQEQLDGLEASGGRDIPEAVWEAVSAAINGFTWTKDTRVVILIGDAPPHPIPRGSVTLESVKEDAKKFGVEIHAIILPQ